MSNGSLTQSLLPSFLDTLDTSQGILRSRGLPGSSLLQTELGDLNAEKLPVWKCMRAFSVCTALSAV